MFSLPGLMDVLFSTDMSVCAADITSVTFVSSLQKLISPVQPSMQSRLKKLVQQNLQPFSLLVMLLPSHSKKQNTAEPNVGISRNLVSASSWQRRLFSSSIVLLTWDLWAPVAKQCDCTSCVSALQDPALSHSQGLTKVTLSQNSLCLSAERKRTVWVCEIQHIRMGNRGKPRESAFITFGLEHKTKPDVQTWSLLCTEG